MENGTYAHYHDNGVNNEDACLSRILGNESVLDVVLDGSTTTQGRMASERTKEILETGEIAELEDVLRLLAQVNSELYHESFEAETTVTAALKKGNQLFVVSAGDSPAYLIREGIADELTTEYRRVDRPSALITAIGRSRYINFHVSFRTLEPNDKLVLVTDGISDNIYPEEIALITKYENTPQQAIAALQELLNQRHSANQGRRDIDTPMLRDERYSELRLERYARFKRDDATAIFRYLPGVKTN